MTAPAILRELGNIHTLLLALVEGESDATCRMQYHPELSALGWHLGHAAFVEIYWLQEVVQGDDRASSTLAPLYVAGRTPKPQRGAALPPRNRLLAWAAATFDDHLALLTRPRPPLSDHPLLRDDYLQRFLLQHHSQHYETMLMVLTQRALAQPWPEFRVSRSLQLQPEPLRVERREIPAGHFRIGGEPPDAYDNELPVQVADLGAYAIAATPVSNAAWLGFMEAGGYEDARYWSEEGERWRGAAQTAHPDHWRRDGRGLWYGIAVRGPYALAPEAPVQGINHHEASAFAAWAGARLPHEYQWEAAQRLGLLEHTGQAWEWCANPFHPYHGFRAFPYAEYSTPWFDGRHYTLRGGSIYTRPSVRRASFRNFYTAELRHMFPGVRLAF